MGTRYRGTAAEIRALNAYIALMRAAESVSARLAPLIARAGLTTSQFGTLEALLHLGPLSQTEIARKLLRSGGNITTVVDNLERGGLVTRRRDPQDRRRIAVVLAPAGRRLIGGVFPRHVTAIVRELGTISAREQTWLRRVCRRLGRGKGS